MKTFFTTIFLMFVLLNSLFAQISISIEEDTIVLQKKKTVLIPLKLNIKSNKAFNNRIVLCNFTTPTSLYLYKDNIGLKYFEIKNCFDTVDYTLSGLTFGFPQKQNLKKVKKIRLQKKIIIIDSTQKKISTRINIIKKKTIADTSYIFFIYTQSKSQICMFDTLNNINYQLFDGQIISDTVVVIILNKFSFWKYSLKKPR